MIDTLRLNLIDCEIKRSCPLTVQPGLIDYSTGKTFNESDLFIDSTGKIVTGSKAYLNHDKFNLTIQPSIESELNDYNRSKLKIKRFKRIDEKIQKDIFDYNSDEEVKGIFLQTSLPRLLSETNLKTLSFDEQKTALKILESELKKYGIKTNIYEANLSRVDTFTNLKTNYSFFAYSNLFNLMECSRMKSTGYADESYLWKNGNQQLAVYDKILELKTKKPELKFHTSNNIMRIENRLLKKRAIDTRLHFLKVSELYKNYNEVKEYHKKEITKRLFKYDLDEIELMTETDLKQKFIYAKEIYGKKWFDKYCFNFGLYSVSKIADVNFLGDIIAELDNISETNIRVKKHRILKKINDSKFYFGKGGIFSNEIVNFKSNVELYNELKTKFYKEVA